MLVLSRRPQQQIIIPALGITLTVLRVGAGRVQIGIDAPRHIRINRSEARLLSETDDADAGTALRLLPAYEG